jgi:hypothetical protein
VNHNSTYTKGTGNQIYLIRRLWRDQPDVAQDLVDGKYDSARKAGIAAGILKVPTIVEVATKALVKCNDEEFQTAVMTAMEKREKKK